jgi:hypothetical protein
MKSEPDAERYDMTHAPGRTGRRPRQWLALSARKKHQQDISASLFGRRDRAANWERG